MNHDGDAAVSWNQASAGGPPVDVVAVRERGAPRRYTRATNADRFTYTRLGIDGRGIVQHAWYARPDGHYGKIFLRTKRPGRVWSAGVQLSPSSQNINTDDDFAVDPAGRITYCLDPLSGAPATVRHQSRLRGGFHVVWRHTFDGSADIAVAGHRFQVTWDDVSDTQRTRLYTQAFSPAPGPARLIGTNRAFQVTALAADGTGIVTWLDPLKDGGYGWTRFTSTSVGPSTTSTDVIPTLHEILAAKGSGIDFVVGYRESDSGRNTTVVHLVH